MESACLYCNSKFKRRYASQKFCSVTCSNRFNLNNKKSFVVPMEYSSKLAEFIGIMLGDGGMTTYQCIISLNAVDDYLYSLYVEDLIKTLFHVPVARITKEGTKELYLIISRKGVVDYLLNIGIKKGNKLLQGLDIPPWVMNNAEYKRMCIRGLIDTDGCIFSETHTINDKKYTYPRLNFTTASPLLAWSAVKILRENNIHPVMRRSGKSVQVENKEEIWQYFKIIGTSNPKHKNRWDKYK